MASRSRCLFCRLVANPDGETLAARLADAFAYGALVFANGNGVATCDRHDREIKAALAELRRELRAAKREAEAQPLRRRDL